MGGCQKDYDGQLEIIRNQIKSGEISLDNLNSKVTLIDEQIAALQKALEDAETTEEHKKDIQAVLKKLDDVKTELEGKIAGLEKKIADNNEELIGIKESIESLEQQFNEKLLTISIEIQRIDVHLDALDERVNALEGQVKALEETQDAIRNEITNLEQKLEEEIAKGDKQSQEQIDKLNKAIDDLTGLQTGLTTKIDDLTKQVKTIATDVSAHGEAITKAAKEIVKINIKIENVIADNAAELGKLRGAIKSIDDKYTVLSGEFGTLKGSFDELKDEYLQKIKELEELINTVNPKKIQEEINAIKKALMSLTETVANHEAEIIATKNFAIDVKDRVDALTEVVTEHGQRISAIEEEIKSIKEDIKNLFDRIQSMVIIPQYTGNYVKLESSDNGGYKLTMKVDIRPFDIAEKIEKGAFSISVKPIEPTPTRMADAPDFTIESKTSNEDKQTFTIIASTKDFGIVYKYSTVTNFQVALALNDVNTGTSKNDRLSEYMGVYYVAPGSADVDALYDFYYKETGELQSNIKEDMALIEEQNFYPGNFLNAYGNFIGNLYPIFNDVTIIAKDKEGEVYDVDFDLAAVADASGPNGELTSCFTVSREGYIQQTKASALPTLQGVRVFIGLQARKNSIKYGKRCYLCVVLQNKD